MTRPQRRPLPPSYPPSYPPYPGGYPQLPQKGRGSQVARVVLIVGVTVLAVAGLAIVATFIFFAAAMSSYGSNK